jgi:hypothetical protein
MRKMPNSWKVKRLARMRDVSGLCAPLPGNICPDDVLEATTAGIFISALSLDPRYLKVTIRNEKRRPIPDRGCVIYAFVWVEYGSLIPKGPFGYVAASVMVQCHILPANKKGIIRVVRFLDRSVLFGDECNKCLFGEVLLGEDLLPIDPEKDLGLCVPDAFKRPVFARGLMEPGQDTVSSRPQFE